jgi:hypothetical protein
MLSVFFNPKAFALVNVLPQGTSFIAAYCVNNVICSLPSRNAQQRRDIARRKLRLHLGNPKCHTARDAQEEIVSHSN